MKREIGKKCIFIFLSVLVFSSSIYLFYQFATGAFFSDFPAHINTVLMGEQMYSLMHYLFLLTFRLNLPDFYMGAAVLMAIIVFFTGFGMYRYLARRVGGMISKPTLMLVAVLLLFVSNIYIPNIFSHFYTHYTKVSQPWHNSTYLLMRMFAVFVTIFYFELYEYAKRNEMHPKGAILFCVFLSLCNFAKPNYFLAFAPMSLLVFLSLFIKEKGRNFKILFIWGMTYLLSMLSLIYMTKIVYSEESNSTIHISSQELVDYLFGHKGISGEHGQLLICEFSNLFFPLFVLIVFVALRLKKQCIELDRVIQGFLLFFVSHMQMLLISEDGPRAMHGNYSWGVYCMGLILFLICIGEWIHAYSRKHIKSKVLFFSGLVIFAVHIYCGVLYYLALLAGKPYIL